jgi:RES domain
LILFRCFAWRRSARATDQDGPLWFPRVFQGEGRHDNPDVYGCLYLADRPLSAVVEQLARFRGQRLTPAMLVRRGLPLALAELELDDAAEVVDLDDPRVLQREALRPSQVATRTRDVTQPQALELYRRHSGAAALRWWSSWEALWANSTVFDRASAALSVVSVQGLSLEDAVVAEAADFFGLRVVA